VEQNPLLYADPFGLNPGLLTAPKPVAPPVPGNPDGSAREKAPRNFNQLGRELRDLLFGGQRSEIGDILDDLIGPLDGPKDDTKTGNDDTEHCILLYNRCINEGWGGDWQCDSCLNFCTGVNKRWPFEHCSPDKQSCL